MLPVMGAIVHVAATTPEAATAFVQVVHDDPAIHSMELGQNSGMHEVVFQSSEVEMGTGFVTLQRLMNEHTPGAGDRLVQVNFG
jgi:hypothetical protein